MGSDSDDWVRVQLDDAQIEKPVRASVWNLLHTLHAQQSAFPDLDLARVVDIFSKLAQNQPIDVEDHPDEVWASARPGGITAGDYVRVMRDAYAGDAGRTHNGKRGRVVGVRYGDVLVKYDNTDDPRFNGVRHAPRSLEKRIR